MPLGWNENARRALYSMEKEKTETVLESGIQREKATDKPIQQAERWGESGLAV